MTVRDLAALRLPGPAGRLGLFGLALLPLVLALGWGVAPDGVALATLVYLGGLALAVRGMVADYPHARAGACNLVTTLRFAMVAGLSAGVISGAEGAGWAIFVLALLALSLDGVDGPLARARGLSSGFGARYDMEVDALLAAALALMLLAQGRGGAALLVLGFARYGFVLAGLVWPWLGGTLEPSWRRKAVCVVQIGVLVALTLPVLPEVAARPLAMGAAALLIWSFTVDIRWLAARR